MQDRVSLYPGRVTLTPVAGQANTYDLVRADQPTQEGTPLNKASLLTDATAALYGLGSDAVPDEVFRALDDRLGLIAEDRAIIILTLADSAGNPIPGALVQGITDERGQAVYSDDNGVARGYISEGSQTIKITGYADIVDYSETISIIKGSVVTKVLTLTTRNYLDIQSSQTVTFSGNVGTVDVALGGGGAGGSTGTISRKGNSVSARGGNGGGAGDIEVREGLVPNSNSAYNIIVGAGGAMDAAGGETSFMGLTASGGSVDGGGVGGYIQLKANEYGSSMSTNAGAGTAGTNSLFASMTETLPYGGSGGGGGAYGYNSGTIMSGAAADGGSPGGGDGAASRDGGQAGTAGLGGGGGGGYAHYNDGLSYTTLSGGSGRVTIRMHLKSTE